MIHLTVTILLALVLSATSIPVQRTIGFSIFAPSPIASHPTTPWVAVSGTVTRELLGMNIATGEHWSIELPSSLSTAQPSIVLQGGHPIVIAGGFDNKLYARNATTGTALWYASVSFSIVSPPTAAVDDEGNTMLVYGGSSDLSIHARNLSGSNAIVWSTAVSDRFSAPVAVVRVAEDDLVVAGGDRSQVHGLELRTGVVRWQVNVVGQVRFKPVCADDTCVVATTGDRLAAFRAASGAHRWTLQLSHQPSCQPLTVQVSGEVIVVSGDTEGTIRAVSIASGQAAWQVSGGSNSVAGCVKLVLPTALADAHNTSTTVSCAFISGLVVSIKPEDGTVIAVDNINTTVIGPPVVSPSGEEMTFLTRRSAVVVDVSNWVSTFDFDGVPWPPGQVGSKRGTSIRPGIIVGIVLAVVAVGGIIGAIVYVFNRTPQDPLDQRPAGDLQQPEPHGILVPPQEMEEAPEPPAQAPPEIAARRELLCAIQTCDSSTTRCFPWALAKFLTDNFTTELAVASEFAGRDVKERELHTISVRVTPADAEPPTQNVYGYCENPAQFTRAWLCRWESDTPPPEVVLECSVCYGDVELTAGRVDALFCTNFEGRHVVCAGCVNRALCSHFDSDKHDIDQMPCPMAPCAGCWELEDTATMLTPETLRKWHSSTVALTQLEAGRRIARQQQATSNRMLELQRELRGALRLQCPFCNLPFDSFSGCVSVRCGVRGADAAHQGCGQRFCGACMSPQPCPLNHGHAFLNERELRQHWTVWRRRELGKFLSRLGPEDATLLQSSMQAELSSLGLA